MRKAIFFGLLILGFMLGFNYAFAADPLAVAPPPNLVPENLLAIGNGSIYPKYVFIADKLTRTLSVWNFKNEVPQLVAYYPMDIGKKLGDKKVSGDDRTPQGIYLIQKRLEMSNVDYKNYGIRAFTLNYPNFFDRLQGKTGYGIWLHAMPDSKSLMQGSEGCVVVRNATIKKLTPLVALNRTPVVILSQVNYVTPTKLASERQAALGWLESWRKAWAGKDIDSYMNDYADNFVGRYKSLHMDKHQWRAYKEWLNKRYKTIHVVVQDPMVLIRQNQAVFHFIQHYQSSGKDDVGEKILYAERDQNGQYKILSEVWRSLGPDVIQAKTGGTVTAANSMGAEASR